MKNHINNRPVALITGASKRIGKSIALELHSRGVDIAIHCNDSKIEAAQLANRLNKIRCESAFVVQHNLYASNDPKQIIKETLMQFNRLDYLINNASIFYPMPINESVQQQINEVIKVNATQPKKLMLLACEEIKKRKGAIVNLIDIYAMRGHKDHSAYVASKSMLQELSKQIAVEMAPEIRVNSVSPGAILWPEDETEEQKKLRVKILEKTAIKRIGKASDISKTVAFLLLDAHYMTGANINVDGGRSLYI
ncbi:MAG: pteridine reductase [Polaribacter sp.]|jgi:pteridine reductase